MRTAPQIRPAGAQPAAALGAPVRVAPTVDPRIASPSVDPRISSPSVDPRISARRIAVRRDEGRRRLRRLTWIGGAVLLVAIAFGTTRTPLLDLDRIEVDGVSRLAPEEVLAVLETSGVRPGEPLVDLDLGRAEAALEVLPAVQAAEVVRHWPGRVEVRITERRPVAAVLVEGGQAVIGADGIVIGIEPGPAGLVLVDGPSTLAIGDRFDDAGLVAVAAAMPPTLVPSVARIATGDGAGAVELRLTAGGVVRLGAADQLGAKLVAAETVLRQVDTSCLAVIDVRVPSAPTVTRRAGCA